jgi:hypothetical protein
MHPTTKRHGAYLDDIVFHLARRCANSSPDTRKRILINPISSWAITHGEQFIYVGKDVVTRFDAFIVKPKNKGCQLDRVLGRERRPIRRKDSLDFLSRTRQSHCFSPIRGVVGI